MLSHTLHFKKYIPKSIIPKDLPCNHFIHLQNSKHAIWASTLEESIPSTLTGKKKKCYPLMNEVVHGTSPKGTSIFTLESPRWIVASKNYTCGTFTPPQKKNKNNLKNSNPEISCIQGISNESVWSSWGSLTGRLSELEVACEKWN